MRVLAIDPGTNGGLAWDSENGVMCENMPVGMSAQADRIREICIVDRIDRVVLERVGTCMPGNGRVGTATFARHVGHLEAILYCLSMPTVQVAPAVWQKKLGALPKDQKARKAAIKEQMARLHPTETVTLAVADALAMLSVADRAKGAITA